MNVNGLWFGKIGPLEELTLKSFSNYNRFVLWTYKKINLSIPNVIVKDAREILPEEDIFYYPSQMKDVPFGGNSIVGFSEVFRYKVLYDKGGWWTDLDVTCLKPLELIKDSYFFRSHGRLPLVANIMKCPPRSQLMKKCYETSKTLINSSTTEWHLGMKIMSDHVKESNLEKYIREEMCNVDIIPILKKYYTTEEIIPSSWHFIHWMNTKFDKNKINKNSCYFKLLSQYNIIQKSLKIF
jgi:hypothetical protein